MKNKASICGRGMTLLCRPSKSVRQDGVVARGGELVHSASTDLIRTKILRWTNRKQANGLWQQVCCHLARFLTDNWTSGCCYRRHRRRFLRRLGRTVPRMEQQAQDGCASTFDQTVCQPTIMYRGHMTHFKS